MSRQWLCLGLIAVLLAAMAMLGCGPKEPASPSSSIEPSSTGAPSSTSALAGSSSPSGAGTSTSAGETAPGGEVPLSAAEARVLRKINEIRAGLVDGTWALKPWPFGPATSDAPDIVVHLKDASADVSALEKEIEAMPEVAKVTYISQDEAMALAKEIYPSPEDLAALERDAFPASLHMWLKDRSPASATKIARRIEGRAGVDEVFGPSVVNPRDGDAADLVSPPDYPSPGSYAHELLDEAEQSLYIPDVTVYLKASAGDASGLGTVIAAMPQVAKVDFVSLEEARTRVASDFKDAPELIPEMRANARSALEIWLKDVSQSENLASELRTQSEVDEVTTGGTDAAEAAEGFLTAFYHKSLNATSVAAQGITGGSEQRKPGRTYFSAPEEGKWSEEALRMSSLFSNMVPEPAKSLQIVDLQRLESSSSHCMYSVTLDLVPLGVSVSVGSGQSNGTHDLNWDHQRQSWACRTLSRSPVEQAGATYSLRLPLTG